jgi:hypothetical protein
MAQFKYTLPSGAKFTVDAPAGTTQTQADLVFYQQVASGSLIGYQSGQSLTSAFSNVTSFELSRQQRGTAGVDNLVVLSIIANLPTTAALPSLSNIPLYNPINQADVVNVGFTPDSVGPLDPTTVKALLAQLVAQVGQPADVMTQEVGLGQYGLSLSQLERAGVVKAGVAARFGNDDPIDMPNPSNFVALLKTPTVWTGKDGLNSVNDLLSNPIKQGQIQVDLMKQSFTSLTASGLITNPAGAPVNLNTGEVFTQINGAVGSLQTLSPQALLSGVNNVQSAIGNVGANLGNAASALGTNLTNAAGAAVGQVTGQANALVGQANALAGQVKANVGALVQNASKFGTAATDLWTKGIPTNISGLQDQIGKMSKFAVGFAQDKLNGLVSQVKSAAAFAGTVNRATVDGAVNRILGSDKIPIPTFSPPSPEALGNLADINKAKAVLKDIQTQAGAVVNQVKTTVGQAQQIAGQAQATIASIQGQGATLVNRIKL